MPIVANERSRCYSGLASGRMSSTVSAVAHWSAQLGLVTAAALMLLSLWVAPVRGTCQLLWPNRDHCGCDNPRVSLYVLQCEQRNLKTLPAFTPTNHTMPQHVLVANFSHNSIATVDGVFFQAGGLVLPLLSLDLSYNVINELQAGALASVDGKLKSLNMSHNRLRNIEPGTVPPQLNLLDFSHNQLSDACTMRIPQAVHVRLGHNGIRELRSDCFSTWTQWNQMEMLDLSGNEIQRIAQDAFKHVTSLKTLLLDDNRLGAVGPTSTPFGGLLPAIESLGDLKTLSVRANGLGSLVDLCSPSSSLPRTLANLDLGDNRIEHLPPFCFKRYHDRTESLTLRIDGNLLTTIDENTFSGLERRLHALNLSRNAISTVVVTALEKMSELRSLDLSWNHIASLAFLCGWEAGRLERLSLAGNRIRRLPPAGCFQKKLALLSIDLSGNRLQTVPAGAFAGLTRLERLDLSDNDLTSLAELAFVELPALRSLRLSNNALVYLRRCTFEHVGSLVEFHYDHNMLHCDCDLTWLKQFTSDISSRGMRDDSVRQPIRHAMCTSPKSGVDESGSSVIDVASVCQVHKQADECLGLSVVDVNAYRNASDVASVDEADGLNVTWQFLPTALGGRGGVSASSVAAALAGRQLRLTVMALDIAKNREYQLGSWSGVYDPSWLQTPRQIWGTVPLGPDVIYKVCVRVSMERSERQQTDCTVYPPNLQKPTTAPIANSPIADEDDSGLHPGAVAAIVLAVILILCIAATLIIVYFMYKRWHSYRPRKEDELAEGRGGERSAQEVGRGSGGSISRRSPLSYNRSEDDEPNEHSPIKMADV